MRKMRTPSSDARFSFNEEPVNIIPLSETKNLPQVSAENVSTDATKPIDTVRVRREQAQSVSEAEREEERRRNRELIDREAAKAAKKPEKGKNGKNKNKILHRVMDVLYKVAAVVLILGSVAMTIATVNLLHKSDEPDIRYVYHYNGTSGYDAPEGVTVNQAEDVRISQPDQTDPDDSSESASTAESESSADYRVVDGKRLQTGLYFDVDDE